MRKRITWEATFCGDDETFLSLIDLLSSRHASMHFDTATTPLVSCEGRHKNDPEIRANRETMARIHVLLGQRETFIEIFANKSHLSPKKSEILRARDRNSLRKPTVTSVKKKKVLKIESAQSIRSARSVLAAI